MKICPRCQQSYQITERNCPMDGEPLLLQDPYCLVGRVLLERYRIDALIGIGGFGAVYSAHHLGINRRVALKILLPNLALGNERFLSLFEREARMAGQLRHENIVDIYDAGRTGDGLAYIAMEWLDGHTLDEELGRHGRLGFEQTGGILRQVAAALNAAHLKGIVHRDLKPSNIMLITDAEGCERVKVLDFGIAKASSEQAASMVSLMVGTPHYASPEQFRLGEPIDGRADIYSLGVVLYQMLTGEVPFNASDARELIHLHQTAPPPSFSQRRPDAPQALEQVIMCLLEKDPIRRPQRATEVVSLFERALTPALESPTLSLPSARSTDGGANKTNAGAYSPTTESAQGQSRVTKENSAQALERTAAWGARAEPAVAGGALPPRKVPLPSTQARKRSGWFWGSLLLGLLILAGIIWAKQQMAKPAAFTSSAPSPSPAIVEPERIEALSYHLEVISDKAGANQGRLVAGNEPLQKGEVFKFHFRPRESGYLYIVAPNKMNTPMTFLTAQPQPATGVASNNVEAGSDYSFPAGSEHWLGVTDDETRTAFTVIFSSAPLSAPAFLSARSGRDLTATEQHELNLFRQQFGTHAVIASPNPGERRQRILISRSARRNLADPIMVDIVVKHR